MSHGIVLIGRDGGARRVRAPASVRDAAARATGATLDRLMFGDVP